MTMMPNPDPHDQAAVDFANELLSRGEFMRVDTGTVISIRPDKGRVLGRATPATSPLRTAVMITQLTEAERDWLADYRRAAVRKRREDRELERQARRAP